VSALELRRRAAQVIQAAEVKCADWQDVEPGDVIGRIRGILAIAHLEAARTLNEYYQYSYAIEQAAIAMEYMEGER